MKVLVVNNLGSGLQDGSIFDFMRKLLRDGDELVVRNTDGSTAIETMLDDAATFDLIVASGGDGTIAAVCYTLRYTNIPILPFPAGTSNLLAVNLDQPDEPHAMAEMVRARHTIDFDIGEMTYNAPTGPVSKGFMIGGGAGFDATIMENSKPLKGTFGSSAYIFSALGSPNPQLAKFTIHLDDEVVSSEAIAVMAMNFAKIHPDISITHANNARDGLLEVVVLKQHSPFEMLPAFIAAFLDRTGHYPTRTEAIGTYKTMKVRVESDPPMNLQYDGEAQQCQTPFEARILPAAVKLIVTQKEYERFNRV
jgi:diacylglycerol kinase family enzyme